MYDLLCDSGPFSLNASQSLKVAVVHLFVNPLNTFLALIYGMYNALPPPSPE